MVVNMSKTKVGHISSFFLYNSVVYGAHKSLATYIKLFFFVLIRKVVLKSKW